MSTAALPHFNSKEDILISFQEIRKVTINQKTEHGYCNESEASMEDGRGLDGYSFKRGKEEDTESVESEGS